MTASEGRPWLDATLSVAERVGLLRAAMTREEKVGQLVQVANPDPVRDAAALAAGAFGTCIVASGEHAGNVRDAGTQAEAVNALQRAAVGTSRLGVPLVVARDVIHGHRTVFPIPLGQAASFDADLVRACARVAAREATADGVRWTFAPMLDVAQDPRWGRVAESWGEDPWLGAHLGVAAVEGFQGADDGGPRAGAAFAPDALAACAKHYVGYGLAQGGRDYAEVDVGPRTLHNRHLRPFRAAVDARVATVMSAFHTLDTVPMTAHEGLLRTHLKGDLGFAGPVVSDWDAVGELERHGVARDAREAALLALRAGVDVDMVTGAYGAHLAALVRSGEVPEELLDDAVGRVLALKVRLGLLDEPFTDPARAARVHLAPEHRALARRAAASAVVLLRNDDGVLPLLAPDGTGAPARVHVTGPFATARAELFGTWTLDGRGEDAVPVADAVRERLVGTEVTVDDGRWPDAALVAAREADVVLACVGEHPMRSGEANSVTSLDLPPGQVEQLEALARVSRRLVVVVLTGRPLALGRLAHVGDALVLVPHPGVEGGHGLVDVLTGAVPASGRLPSSIPWVTGQVPLHHDHLPTGRPLDPDGPVGRYRDHQDGPMYPFGFGLGYAPVEYGALELSTSRLEREGRVDARVRVANRGDRPTVETVQLYARALRALVSRPVSELVGVRRVELAPGDERVVTFAVDHDLLAHRDAVGRVRHDGGRFVLTAGPHAGAGSSAELDVEPAPPGPHETWEVPPRSSDR